MNKTHIAMILFMLCSQGVFSQSDTLVFNSYNKVVGEIKKLERGILEVDAQFVDENLKIKWLSIKEIYTQSKFIVNIKDKTYQGRISSISNEKVKVFDEDSIYAICNLEDIVYLSQLKEGFSNRFNAALELGFNLTQAQNMRQFSLRSAIGYKANKWSIDASYNIIRSTQNNTEQIKRTDGLLNYRRILYKNWYGITTISTLSNTEQKIDIRANSQIGLGNFIYATNKAYWGIKIGVNNNLEKFLNESNNRNSWEGYLGTELNLYDVGDINLTFGYIGYTGLTKKGRYRADINFDLKYNLPLDFFIRTGISFNYDNKPANSASKTDYVIRSGIGWEW
jgi:hypothetical protein